MKRELKSLWNSLKKEQSVEINIAAKIYLFTVYADWYKYM